MKKLILHLLAIGCVGVALSASVWAQSQPLTFGQVVTGSITAVGAVVSYSFSANTDDEIDVTMVTTSGTLVPKLVLRNSVGTVLASANPGGCSGTTIEMNNFELPSTSSYTVTVSDCSGSNTGSYALYIQRTNNPSGAVSLPFAQTLSGTIASPAQNNSYTVSANVGDQIDFTLLTTSGSLVPKIRLFEPNGSLLASANPGGCSGSTIEMNGIEVPATGTYFVLIADCTDTNTGNYDLYAQRTANASGSVNLPFGQVQTGTISSATQENAYTFTANAEDVLYSIMITTSGTLVPRMRLYEPNGALLASVNPGGCSGTTTQINTIQLPVPGTYTMLVGDCTDVNTGNYDIFAQLTNNPAGASDLSFAQIASGTIGSVAQFEAYTLSANVNDVLNFTTLTTSGNLVPLIRLYDPNGALLASANPGGCSGSGIEMNGVQVPATGTYNLLVGDCTAVNTGSYDLYVQRTDNPWGPVNLPFGQVQTGSISSEAQDNAYTFSANANDVLSFTMLTTSGSLVPRLRLYEPNGTLINSANPGGCSGSGIQMTTGQLPGPGTYTLLVDDCTDLKTGNYDIYVQRLNNPAGPATLLFAQTQNGLIGSATAHSSYIFSANVNDVIDFTLQSTSGSKLVPWIGLYEPNGTLLAQANPGGCSGSTIEMNTVLIPVPGIYTALIGDCTYTNTGNYVLYAQDTNNPLGPVPVLWSQVQSASILSQTQSDTYTFYGTINNTVSLTMTTTSGNLVPKMRLYGPSGSLVGSANPGGCSGTTTSLTSVVLPATGPYTLLLGDCTDTNTGNFNLSSQCFGTCPVEPAITWATPAAIIYGTPLSSTQLDASANVPGSFVYSPTAGQVLTAGPYKLSATFTPSDTTDYSTVVDYVQLTVNQATPAITWSTPAPILVGTPLSATQLDATSSVAGGSFVYSQPIGTVLAAGVYTLTVTFYPTDTVDYTTATGSVQLMVNNPVPAITGLFPASALAGSAAETLTINGTNFLSNSTVTYNGALHTVTFVSSTQLQIGLSTSDLATPGAYAVVVTNPPQGGGASNSSSFTVIGPVASVQPGSLTFGNQVVGSPGNSQPVNLSNTGYPALTIAGIATSGDFTQTNNCPASLASSSSCTINVTFTPSASGTRTGTLIITDNSNEVTGSTQTVSLIGSSSPSFQQVNGLLSQISVGADGTVWGLNSAGQPYRFNSTTQTWQQAPGVLAQIAVGSFSAVWGLNASGQVYHYDTANNVWDSIPGILSQIAVGSDGDLWGINSASQVFHWNAPTQTWAQIPGLLAQVAVGYDGAVWGVNASQQILHFNPGTQSWQQVSGSLKQVAVGGDGDAWGLNSANQAYHFDTLNQQWDNTGATLKQISVGSATNVWGFDSTNNTWCFNGQTQAWNQVQGQLTQIAVGEDGAVWGLNNAHQIFQFLQPTQATRTLHALAGSLAQVAVGLDGSAWGIDAAEQVWHFNAQQQSWQQIPGSLAQIAVGFGGNVWGLNAAGQVWHFNPSQGWNQITGSLVQIAVGADGSVWGLDSGNGIWKFNSASGSLQQIPGSLTQISVGADGTVWGLSSGGHIWHYNGAGWDSIPGILSYIAVGSATNVWGIDAGQVWKYNGQNWVSLPGILSSLAVAFDGTVWGLNSANQIWRFNAQTQSWDSIEGQMSQISVGADAVVWGLNASGQTYEYW